MSFVERNSENTAHVSPSGTFFRASQGSIQGHSLPFDGRSDKHIASPDHDFYFDLGAVKRRD